MLESEPQNWIIVDGRKMKVWEMDLDDLIELEDEIMGDEGELDSEAKDYIHDREFKNVLRIEFRAVSSQFEPNL